MPKCISSRRHGLCGPSRNARSAWCLLLSLGLLMAGCQGLRKPVDSGSEAEVSAVADVPAEAVSADPEVTWRSELYGQDWTPPADKSFATDKLIQDFSYAGYARGEKPVPSWDNAPVLNVVDFGADPTGERDSTTAIQQALHKAATYEEPVVVYLPEGAYHVSRPEGATRCLLIHSSNTVLRGAGPDKTFILNTSISMRASQIIKVSPMDIPAWKDEEKPVSLITRDLAGPTTVIPVENTDGFKVGDTVIVGQDTTPEWIAERGEEDSWLGVEKMIGNIMYLRRLVKVDPDTNELTIDIPTRYTLKTRDNAKVYAKTGLLENVGVEGFSIGNVEHPGEDGWEPLDFTAPDSAYTKHLIIKYDLDPAEAKKIKSAYHVYFSFAIYFNEVIDGWIENVHTFQAEGNARGSHLLSNGIRIKECRGISVIDCDFSHALYGGGGGNGYMYRLDDANECLFVDCKAEASRHGYSISGMGSSGNVFLRCSDKDTATQAAPHEGGIARGSDSHMYFSQSNLYDGCVADNSWFEARDRYAPGPTKPKHGTTSAHTVFWNTTGLSNSLESFVVYSNQGDYGYVIGTQGPVSAVKTEVLYPERQSVTDPVDHVEGVGEGALLQPQSLYLDQLNKRLGQVHNRAGH